MCWVTLASITWGWEGAVTQTAGVWTLDAGSGKTNGPTFTQPGFNIANVGHESAIAGLEIREAVLIHDQVKFCDSFVWSCINRILSIPDFKGMVILTYIFLLFYNDFHERDKPET